MTSGRVRRYLLSAVLVAMCLQAAADEWGPLSRENALVKLSSSQSRERREALARLAEVGTAEDVPLMMRMLWDDDRLVRGMAEQSLSGLWMRANDTTVERMFRISIDLIQQSQIEPAIDRLDEIIAFKPDFAEAWNKRGDAYSYLGDYDRALADYRRALELNPYHFGVMESCGQIWLEREDARKAAEYFRRALDLNPNLVDVAMILRELEERLDHDRI